MGLLDSEIENIKSRNKVWVLCKFCTMPFLAFKDEFACQRCMHFVQYDNEKKHKFMIYYFLTTSLVGVLQSIIATKFIFLSKNTSLLYFILVCTSILVGSILWKIIKRISI